MKMAKTFYTLHHFTLNRTFCHSPLIVRQTGTKYTLPWPAIRRAAVRRCLCAFARSGYVAVDERNFSLRPMILLPGHACLSRTPLAVSALTFRRATHAPYGQDHHAVPEVRAGAGNPLPHALCDHVSRTVGRSPINRVSAKDVSGGFRRNECRGARCKGNCV